eukprot:1971661-Heterocapsa_arctica.AAC.1
MAQHSGKAEGLVTLVGTGSMIGTNYALKEIPGTRLAAIYIGPHLSHDGTVSREIRIRIAAAHRAWYDFRTYWSMSTPLALKKLLFRSIVLCVLLDGLCSFVVRATDMKALQATLCKLARRILAGQACDKAEKDGQKRYRALSNHEVLCKVGLSDVATELLVTRIRFLQ